MAELHPKAPSGTEGQEPAPRPDPGHAMSDPSLTHTHTHIHTQHKQDRYTYHLKGLWEHFLSIFNLNEAPGGFKKNGQVIITFLNF